MSVWTRRAHEICGLDLGIPSASRAEESAGSRSSRLIWIVCAPTVSGPLCVSVSIGPNANSMSLEPPEQLCLIFFGSESGSSEKLVLESLPSLEMAKSPSRGISGSWSSSPSLSRRFAIGGSPATFSHCEVYGCGVLNRRKFCYGNSLLPPKRGHLSWL